MAAAAATRPQLEQTTATQPNDLILTTATGARPWRQAPAPRQARTCPFLLKHLSVHPVSLCFPLSALSLVRFDPLPVFHAVHCTTPARCTLHAAQPPHPSPHARARGGPPFVGPQICAPSRPLHHTLSSAPAPQGPVSVLSLPSLGKHPSKPTAASSPLLFFLWHRQPAALQTPPCCSTT